MAADPRARAAAASILAVCLLTVNSGFALYKARGDMLSTAFIALSYLDLALLLAWRLVRRRDQPQPSPPPGKAPAGQVLVVSVVCLAMLMLTLLLGSQLRLPVKVFTVVIFPGVVVMMFIIYSLGGFLYQRSFKATLPLVQPLPRCDEASLLLVQPTKQSS